MTNQISIRGAREHNLKNLDIDIPRDKLVVITGLSGSGKSSLAFDTIYAEGQRRYVESLSAYARQFLAQNQKPDVESVEGLSPAIAIEQKTTGQNPRSTVATLTEIYDYLRLLYARAGRAYCYQCGQEIEAQSATRIVDQILDLPLRTKILVMAPIVRGRKGAFIRDLTQLRKEGFGRVRVDGELRELNEEITLDKKKAHSIEVVIDRLIIKEGIKTRLSDSVELALKMAEGLVLIGIPEGEEFLFSEHFACTQCDISYPEAEPRLFSFNSPFGACRRCDGLGYAMDFDPAAVVPDTLKSIKDGALEAWTSTTEGWTWTQLEGVADHFGGSLETPWEDLSSEFKDALLYGTGETSVKMIYKKGKER
ncbi:excinuclease ABC subunit A, partial [Myxococcota bacterium]|nr:excinuclease ABC subunit A [Myxococcota bacterium]